MVSILNICSNNEIVWEMWYNPHLFLNYKGWCFMRKLFMFILSFVIVISYYSYSGKLQSMNSDIRELNDNLHTLVNELVHTLVNELDYFTSSFSDSLSENSDSESNSNGVSSESKNIIDNNTKTKEPEIIPLRMSDDIEYHGEYYVDCVYNHEHIKVGFKGFDSLALGYSSEDGSVFGIKDSNGNLVLYGNIIGSCSLLEDKIYSTSNGFEFNFMSEGYDVLVLNVGNNINSSVYIYYYNSEFRNNLLNGIYDYESTSLEQELVDILCSLSFELIENDEMSDNWTTDFEITEETQELVYDNYTFLFNPISGFSLKDGVIEGHVHLINEENTDNTIVFSESSYDLSADVNSFTHNNGYTITEDDDSYCLWIDFDGIYQNFCAYFYKEYGYTVEDINEFVNAIEVEPNIK